MLWRNKDGPSIYVVKMNLYFTNEIRNSQLSSFHQTSQNSRLLLCRLTGWWRSIAVVVVACSQKQTCWLFTSILRVSNKEIKRKTKSGYKLWKFGILKITKMLVSFHLTSIFAIDGRCKTKTETTVYHRK